MAKYRVPLVLGVAACGVALSWFQHVGDEPAPRPTLPAVRALRSATTQEEDAGVPARACTHRYFGARHAVYELRSGDALERLRIEPRSSRATTDGVLTTWSATLEAADGSERSGAFETDCSATELELPLDAVATSGPLQFELPTFAIPSALSVGQRWCEQRAIERGRWQRCYEVIEVGQPIDTPAGRFEAAELFRSDTIELRGETYEDEAYLWLAEGIGVVKLDRPEGGATRLVELGPSSPDAAHGRGPLAPQH